MLETFLDWFRRLSMENVSFLELLRFAGDPAPVKLPPPVAVGVTDDVDGAGLNAFVAYT
jgi:hypothetical protein